MESNKEQTAVNWLSEQLNKIGISEELIGHLIKEAKALEKEQIKDAFYVNIGWGGKPGDKCPAEEYFEDTFE